MTNYDLTVVGAGLVGATTALALAQHDIRVRLIDSKPALALSEQPDLRVVALNIKSIQWLKSCGIFDQLDPERTGIFHRLAIEDNGKSLGFDTDGVVVENNDIIARAQQACLAHPNIQCHFSERFNPDELTHEPEKLVIAADGAHSRIREFLNIQIFSHDYHQRAHVAYVNLETSHQHVAWQHFLPTGPLAFLPCADMHRASIVWTLPEDSTLDITAESLQHASAGHFGEVTLASAVASFPLRLQHANQYYKNNVVFLGDAIHSIHPMAGQGVNLGFADAAAWVDLLIHHKPHHWTQSLLLKRYQRERKLPNTLMVHTMTALNLIFKQEHPYCVSLRAQGLSCFDKIPPLKNLALSSASGLTDS